MYRICLLTLALIISAGLAVSADDGAGGYGGAFLQMPIGARPCAMGGAYIALADDGVGPLFNPAGMASLDKVLVSSSYRLMDLGRSLSYVSFAFPTAKQSTLGFGWRYAGSGAVEARNNDGDRLGFELSQHNHEFTVVFAKRFENFFSAGFKGGYLHSQFAEMTSFSVSLDLGLMLYIDQLVNREKRDLMPVKDIRAGLVVRNLAAKYRWNNENYLVRYYSGVLPSQQDDDVPMEIGIGGSARFFKRKLVVAADLLGDEISRFAFHGGSEYFLSPQFALRGGYSDGRFTAGTGYVFGFSNRVLAIDYAFSTDKVGEGSEHIFSFDLLF